jgi:hypothetical protein
MSAPVLPPESRPAHRPRRRYTPRRRGRLWLVFALGVSLVLIVVITVTTSLSAHAAAGGTVTAWGDNSTGELNIPLGLTGVTALSADGGTAVALKSNGTVVAWGDNSNGQTAVPPNLTGVSAIAEGRGFSLALKSDGSVVAWGDSGSPQTTVPSGLSGVTAIAAGQGYSLALESTGTVVGWGTAGSPATTVPGNLTGVTAISAGATHALALLNNGTVVAWGDNSNGETTVPSGLGGITAIAAGQGFSLALAQSFHISAVTLPGGVVGVPFTQTPLGTVNGLAPITWTVSAAAALPPGLNLDPAGVLGGSPTAPGTYDFTVQAVDSTPGSPQTTSAVMSVTVLSPLAAVFVDPLPTATVDTAYKAAVSAAPTGGVASYTWSISQGTLPAGLNIAPTTGVISGTPTATGASTFTVEVRDSSLPSQGIQPATESLDLTVQALPTTTTLTTSPSPSQAGQQVTLTATVTSAAAEPTGTVTFTDGALTLGTAALGTTTKPATATLTTSSLVPGTHDLAAGYSGDAAHQSSNSAVVAQSIQAVPPVTLQSDTSVTTPGSVITVTGGGLPAGQTVEIELAGLQQTQSATVAADGSLSAQIVLWQQAAGGPHQLEIFTTTGTPTELVTTPLLIQPEAYLPPVPGNAR